MKRAIIRPVLVMNAETEEDLYAAAEKCGEMLKEGMDMALDLKRSIEPELADTLTDEIVAQIVTFIGVTVDIVAGDLPDIEWPA